CASQRHVVAATACRLWPAWLLLRSSIVSSYFKPQMTQIKTDCFFKINPSLSVSSVATFLSREERADVRQQLVRTNRTVPMLFDEPIDYLVDPSQLIGIRRLGRGGDLHDVFQVRKDLLLDRFLQALVRVVLKRLALASVGRNPYQYLLPESILRVLGDANLLLDRTHQLFVRLHLLFGNRILDPFLVAERLDVVEIVVAHRARHLFKRVDESSLHFNLRELVVLFARLRNVVQIPFTLFTADARVLLESVFDRPQRIDRVDARDAVTNKRARESIDDVARRNPVHAFANSLFFQLAHIFRLVTLDVFAVVKLHLLYDIDVLSLRLFEASH